MSHNFECHCEEASQSHCICFHMKGREEMGVGNPALDHRKMAWSPIIGQGLSLVGRATRVAEKSYIQPACLMTYWMRFKFMFSLS